MASVSEEIKKNIRSVLISNPKGVKVGDFLRDYRKLLCTTLNFRKCGFSTLPEFLNSMPDVAKLEWSPHDQNYKLFAVTDPDLYLHSALKKGTRTAGIPQKPTKRKKWEDEMFCNCKGQYAVSFPKAPGISTMEVKSEFTLFGEVPEVTFSKMYVFIRYFNKKHALDALEKFHLKYEMLIPEEKGAMKTDHHQKPKSAPPKDDLVEVFVGDVPRHVTRDDILNRVDSSLVYQVRDMKKGDERYMFLMVKRSKVDQLTKTLHNLQIDGHRIVAELSNVHKEPTTKQATSTRTLPCHKGVLRDLDYDKSSSSENLDTVGKNIKLQANEMAKRGLGSSIPDLEAALPDLEPVPDLEPGLPDLEPALPDLEPVLPDLEPVLPDLEPALPDLEPVPSWQPVPGWQPVPDFDPAMPFLEPVLLDTSKRKSVPHNARQHITGHPGHQSPHHQKVTLLGDYNTYLKDGAPRMMMHNHHQNSSTHPPRYGHPTNVPPVHQHQPNSPAYHVNANSMPRHHAPRVPQHGLNGQSWLSEDNIVHIANFTFDTNWRDLMTVFDVLSPVRVTVDRVESGKRTHAVMLLRNRQSVEEALTMNGFLHNGRQLMIYLNDDNDKSLTVNISNTGDAKMFATSEREVEQMRDSFQKNHIDEDAPEEDFVTDEWKEKKMEELVHCAVASCCPYYPMWTPSDLLDSTVRILITNTSKLDRTYVWGQVIDPQTDSGLHWLVNATVEMQDESNHMEFQPDGQTCLAMYNEEWFRGCVVELVRDTATVFALDYGNTVKVKRRDLRDLPVEFWECTAQAWPIKIVSSVVEDIHSLENATVRAQVVNKESETPLLAVRIIGDYSMFIEKGRVDQKKDEKPELTKIESDEEEQRKSILKTGFCNRRQQARVRFLV